MIFTIKFKDRLKTALREYEFLDHTESYIANLNNISRATLSKYVNLKNIPKRNPAYKSPKKPAKKKNQIRPTTTKSTNVVSHNTNTNNNQMSEEKLANNSSNNVVTKKAVNSPKLNSSATSYQSPSNQTNKLLIKNETKSTPTSLNAPKEISFMPYLTKKEKQDEHDIEVITDPREVDPFTLLQFMNIYTDVAHQLFVYKHWDILSKRLVQHHGLKALRKAKRIQNRFKLKIKAREKAEKSAKHLVNKIYKSIKKFNNKKDN